MHEPPKSAYVRRTVPLKGTFMRHTARLDLRSAIAIRYAQAWFRRATTSHQDTVHDSCVIRRALAVYMTHLASASLDAKREAEEVVQCSRSSLTSEDTRAETLARLEVAEGAAVLPSFHQILNHPGAAEMVAEVDQRAEELYRQLRAERRPRATRGDVIPGAPAVR